MVHVCIVVKMCYIKDVVFNTLNLFSLHIEPIPKIFLDISTCTCIYFSWIFLKVKVHHRLDRLILQTETLDTL